MGEIININGSANLTMSSREIADLVEKRHDHVLRDIRVMLMTLYGDETVKTGIPEEDKVEKFFNFIGMGIDSPKLGNERIQGLKVLRDQRGFVSDISLDHSHTMTLISGYNVKLRKAIVDRWQQLESEASQAAADPMKALSDPAMMRSLLLTYTEKVINLEHKVEVFRPKAEAFDRLETYSEGSFCVRDAAKNLHIQEKKFTQYLMQIGWTYRRAISQKIIAHATVLKQGLMEHKYTTGEKSDGSEWKDTQARITAKGMAKLSLMLTRDLFH